MNGRDRFRERSIETYKENANCFVFLDEKIQNQAAEELVEES